MKKIGDIRKFYSIPYADTNKISLFLPVDYIFIEEKVDGSNASIYFENDELHVCSRKFELDNENNLFGCYEWVMSLGRNKLFSVLGNRYVLYFEWLSEGKSVKYDDSAYNKGYVFAVKDVESDSYISQESVYDISNKLQLETVPVLYTGMFTSWKDMLKFVGESRLGATVGEGIVVKSNCDKNHITNSRGQKMLKIVRPEFLENTGVLNGGNDYNEINKSVELYDLVLSIVTKARVIKMLYNLAEEGIVSTMDFNNWSEKDINKAKGKLTGILYADCLKEEPDIVKLVGKPFGALAKRISDGYLREIFGIQN